MARTSPVTLLKTTPVLRADVEAVFIGRTNATTLNEHREAERFTENVMDEVIRNASSSLKRIDILDPATLLCSGSTCAIAINNTVMYKDDNHITPQGSLLFENEIIRLIE
jgi:hypothetical protein